MKVKIYSKNGEVKGDQDFDLREDFKEVSPQVVIASKLTRGKMITYEDR